MISVLPDRGPTILGAKTRYSIADDLNVTCMSGPSKPPSFLQWLVNDKEVSEPQKSLITSLNGDMENLTISALIINKKSIIMDKINYIRRLNIQF